MKRPVVHRTSDWASKSQQRMRLELASDRPNITGFHVRKLRDRAVDRKKRDVRRTAPSPKLHQWPCQSVSPKCMILIFSGSTRN